MPRIPQIGAAFALAVTGSFPFTVSIHGQTPAWHTEVGYVDLIGELGGVPPGDYGGVEFIAAADAAWRYRKGTSEASSPVDAWRMTGFTEDSSWFTGQTPIGYGDGDDNTVLGDMRGPSGYTSVYLRRTFSVAPGGIPDRLLLRVYVDDGAVVWINGVEAARLHVGGGFLGFNQTAAVHEAEWEEVLLPDASQFLVEGDNVLAIHALNQSITSSDFSIDAELRAPALRVTQAEGSAGTNFLPEAWPGGADPVVGDSYPGTGGADGKTFFVRSVDTSFTYDESSHARTVGVGFIYGIGTRSLAPLLTEVDSYAAGTWLEDDFLRLGTSAAPKVELNPLQNHSWILNPDPPETTVAELNEAMRRADYAIGRDRFLCVVGLNNESTETVPPLLASAYNVVSVGRTDGEHSRGGTLSDYDGAGRTKPEIVAPGTATSWATGIVSSAGTMLIAASKTFAAADELDAPPLKAMLMAGATKGEFAGWARTPTQPIDTVFGAGELNVQNSYHILVGGKVPPTATGSGHGWDGGSFGAAGNAVYTIEVTEDIGEFSAVLTWNRSIDTAPWLGGGSFSATVADMGLQLHRLGATGPVLCDASDSAVDNVEHVYLRGLPRGSYTLTVDTDLAADYGIAWRANPAPMPSLAATKGTTADELVFDFANLATGKSYTLEKSTDLATWTPEHIFTATAPTDSYIDTDGRAPLQQFFKLSWNPVN